MPIIVPADAADQADLAARLLLAAGDRPERVRTVTSTGFMSFDVPADLYDAIGYAADPAPAGDPEPAAPAAVRGSAKKSKPTAPSGDATPKEGP